MSSSDRLGSVNKQAACLNCRKSKVKCKRSSVSASSACERCQLMRAECTVPGTFHVGRQKGVKNKRSGLDKAIYQIEEALKKSRNEDGSNNEANTAELQRLLNEARNKLPAASKPPSTSISTAPEQEQPRQRENIQVPVHENDELALDDAENPLQLLARASDLRLSSPQGPPTSVSSSLGIGGQSTSKPHPFFRPMRATLDGRASEAVRGLDLDPIDAGLVTLEEADMLLTFFYENIAHTRWGLDPAIHTLDFIRNQSSFLLTTTIAASSLFLPTTAALAKRLSVHQSTLAQRVMQSRLRSVEIVLAFLMAVPWMKPGDHPADDFTGLYISVALSIALDLSLNKVIVPSTTVDQDTLKRTPSADCIDARKALAMDGFDEVNPDSELGRRLLRRRERTWIALFALERGVCLARGRNYAVPITPLVKHCDRWPVSDIAVPGDSAVVSMSVLRRDLDDLWSSIRLRCDSYGATDVGSKVAREIGTSIEGFFEQWLALWTDRGQKTLPPYVDILITHTRLSTYGGVINHPTAPLEVKRLFRSSALSSALNVMRAAIQGESRLMSMPNNTAIMISFAACVALNLTTPSPGNGYNLAPSTAKLIEEAAAVLERVGSTPKHRNGQSVYYGEYLRDLVRQASAPSIMGGSPSPHVVDTQHRQMVDPSFASNNAHHPINHVSNSSVALWDDPLHFSTMSDDQINEAILNAGQGLDATMTDMSSFGGGSHGFSWIDWMNPPEFGFQ